MNNLVVRFQKWFETSSRKQKLTAVLFAFSLLSTLVLFMLNGTSKTTDDPLGSSPLYFISVFVKLGGVLLLIVACSSLFRRWLQPGLHGKTTRRLRLLETVRLSPKQAIHLISIGDQQLLIGATDQSVSLLSPIEADLHATEIESPTPQPALDFGSLLRSFNSQPAVKS
jgi:flagellar biosynthetic protein FliO